MTFEKETVYDEKSGSKIVSLKHIEETSRKPDSLEQKVKTVQCPKCRGFGRYTVDDQRNQETCDVCHGIGKVDVVLFSDVSDEEIDALAIRLDAVQFVLDEYTKTLKTLEKEREMQKQKLTKEYARCKKIAETTKSELWREGARWNMKLIEDLLGL